MTLSKTQKIEIHSDIRIPFEPKGEALELRENIKRNLKQFKPHSYNHLIACLTTSKIEFFDVENILFYNIGSGAFSHLYLDEMTFSLNQNAGRNGKPYSYEYKLSEGSENTMLRKKIIDFEFDIEKIKSDMKPFDYWLAFKHGSVKVHNLTLPEVFGLSIIVELPKKHKNLAALIKPMIDGVISAFHYQSNIDEKVIEHIASKQLLNRDRLVSDLSNKEYAFLGNRNLVYPYRESIKWNPEDEKCTFVNIKQVACNTSKPRIIGQAFIVE